MISCTASDTSAPERSRLLGRGRSHGNFRRAARSRALREDTLQNDVSVGMVQMSHHSRDLGARWTLAADGKITVVRSVAVPILTICVPVKIGSE